MLQLFLVCLVVGAVLLVAQIVFGLFGLGADAPDVGGHSAGAGVAGGLDLLSVRSIAAAATAFGATGLVLAGSVPAPVAAAVALLPAAGAAAGTAWLTRAMLRLESDGSIRLEDAGGQIGTVYTPIPGNQQGTGLVQFALQGRTIELTARTRDGADLPTGTSVLVVSVDPETETAEVIATPLLEGLS
jgi:hypothetical protein